MYVRKTTLKNNKIKTVDSKTTKVNVLKIDSEHSLQKACVAKLKAHNMLCFCTDVFNGISFIKDIRSKAIYKQHMEKMGAQKGQPDLIVIHNGICTFIEFKYGKGKKSVEQEFVCNQLSLLGYEVLEWRTLEDCSNWIVSMLSK